MLLLFGLAAKIEVGMQAPILDWPDLIEEGRNNATCYCGESFLSRSRVGQNDTKKNGRLKPVESAPKLYATWTASGPSFSDCALDLGVKLPLMNESAWDHRHTLLSRVSKDAEGRSSLGDNMCRRCMIPA